MLPRGERGPPLPPGGRAGVPDPDLRLLESLVDAHVRIAGDVVEVSLGVWAIHGSIPVDGEVILAEFSVPDEARSVLDRLGPNR